MIGYTISTDSTRMDLDLIHNVLSQSYWARNIPKETVAHSIANSLCFGVYGEKAGQVAFARAVTDSATFAYIGDVFVVEGHRGKGIGKWLMQYVKEHTQLQGLRRILLATRDAHGLYAQLGFKPLADPDIFMELWNPDVY